MTGERLPRLPTHKVEILWDLWVDDDKMKNSKYIHVINQYHSRSTQSCDIEKHNNQLGFYGKISLMTIPRILKNYTEQEKTFALDFSSYSNMQTKLKMKV